MIPDYVNVYLRSTKGTKRPRMRLANGKSLSVQASGLHYCHPRKDYYVAYSTVEVGYPSDAWPFDRWAVPSEPDIHCPHCKGLVQKGEPSGVFGYVDVDIVNAYIHLCGGICHE